MNQPCEAPVKPQSKHTDYRDALDLGHSNRAIAYRSREARLREGPALEPALAHFFFFGGGADACAAGADLGASCAAAGWTWDGCGSLRPWGGSA
jgi:hypothetical protein